MITYSVKLRKVCIYCNIYIMGITENYITSLFSDQNNHKIAPEIIEENGKTYEQISLKLAHVTLKREILPNNSYQNIEIETFKASGSMGCSLTQTKYILAQDKLVNLDLSDNKQPLSKWERFTLLGKIVISSLI